MREFNTKRIRRGFAFVAPALLALFLSAGAAGARAQDGDAPDATPGAQRELDARRRDANAAGLLRVLNLTPEQRAQIAAIRRETQPQGRALGARLRQARRALDEAIYAANPDEAAIEERLRELGAAQSAVVRLRSLTELRIRRVLSPEQLDAFRRLQRQTRARRQQRMNRRQTRRQEGDLPADAPAARLRDAMRRRNQEQQQQQQRQPDEQNAPTPAAPRARRPAASLPPRDRRT